MSSDRLVLCLGVHNHQPVGNFDDVVAEVTERAYRPFLERLLARPEVRLTVHFSGSLLEWLREHASPTFDLLGAVVARGQVELLTGGFYEPVLAILPDRDKVGQIARLSDFLKESFGVRPRGMWLAERVWEPHLPKALREAGVDYVLVDDSHFGLAGLDPETIGGYYLTEEQGALLAVFPISQRLRYLIPFAVVDESIAYLDGRRRETDVVTVMDDGEKFGAWPGTYAHVYEQGWLDRFFDRILATPWLGLATFSEILERWPATDRVYLPTASYREMGEWVLSFAAGRDLARATRGLERLEDGERLATLLRGGFWRSFLVKYPEVADTYWKMLRLSEAIQEELSRRPREPALHQARLALWRGQANDAYWHGVFGGCYVPHLRRAVKQSLLEAERRLAEATGPSPLWWSRGDANGDGRVEILVRTPALAVTVNPDLGGGVTELGWLSRGLDLADVLARRPELYHDRILGVPEESRAVVSVSGAPPSAKEDALGARLAYDELRRASLLDGWFDAGGALDPVSPWREAQVAFGSARLESTVAEGEDGGLTITMKAHVPGPLRVEKRIRVHADTVEARYRLEPTSGEALNGRFAVQWNLALTAGHAPGRYLTLPDEPSLGSTGHVAGRTGVRLVDEWIGVEAELEWSGGAELGWGPVETVSVSEGGFERIYQGTALLLTWPIRDARHAETWTRLRVRDR